MAEDAEPPAKRPRCPPLDGSEGAVESDLSPTCSGDADGSTSSDLPLLSAFIDAEDIRLAPGLQLQPTPHGLGIVAHKPLPAGALLLTVPRPAILTVPAAMATPVGAAVLRCRGVPARACLYGLLVRERFGPLPAVSRWGPYIRSLPARYGDPLWFSAAELAALQGTNIVHRVRDVREELETLQCYLMAAATEDPGGALGDPSIYTAAALRWAHSAFFSRRFTGKVAGLENCTEGCLVPVLDILNHRAGARAAWDVFEDRLEMCLEEPVGEGEEAFNNYGEKGNEELLMNFGFVVPDNPHDVARIRLALPPHRSPGQQRLERHWQLEEDHAYSLRPDGLNPKLLLALGLFSASPEEEAFLQEVPGEPAPEALGPWLGLEALRVLWRNLHTRLRALSTTPVDGQLPNLDNIGIYRTGQRSILEANCRLVLRRYQDLRQDAMQGLQAELANQQVAVGSDGPWMVPATGFLSDCPVVAGQPVLTLGPTHLVTAEGLRRQHPQFAACLSCVEGLEDEAVLQLWLLSTLCDLRLDDLPAPDPLYLWADQDVAALRCPAAAAAAADRRQELADLHRQLFPALSRAFPRLFKRKRTASPAALLSAAALVDAYAVALPTLAGPVPALLRHPAAPGAGLRLPHCPLPNAVLRWDASTSTLTVDALCDLAAAQPVTISHGYLDNAALLLRFGACLPANPCETVLVATEVDGQPATLLVRRGCAAASGAAFPTTCPWDGASGTQAPEGEGSPQPPEVSGGTEDSCNAVSSSGRLEIAAAFAHERRHIVCNFHLKRQHCTLAGI
eukprot:EG_transcript_3815